MSYFQKLSESIFQCLEILTRLEDEVINDEKWEVKIYQVWTVPVAGRVKYNILLFQKGGIVYRANVVCVLSKCGDSDVLFLSPDHLNMLKLVTLRKLKEEYKDLNIRMELPGGLDVNRVTLPVILNSPPSSEPPVLPSSTPAQANKTKAKSGGILGLFKSSSPEPQPQNNLTASPSVKLKAVEAELEPITNNFPPPKIQRQHTLIEKDPKSFQAILSKDSDTEKNVNSEVSKETLKVPVTDIFPEKLTEQNYARKKKTPASTPDIKITTAGTWFSL